MSDVEVIDHDDPGQEIAVRQPPGTLFRTDDPGEVVARATATANSLMQAVRAHDAGQTDKAKQLVSVIQGKDYPKVECWTLLGTMLGVFPVCVWTRQMDNGWEARVEAHTMTGVVVGAAEAECLRSESRWARADDYALRSMAQTRATSKALRIPLGFVMTLAGLEATPAEEIPQEPATTTTVSAPEPQLQQGEKMATVKQTQLIAIERDRMIEAGQMTEEQYRASIKTLYGVESAKQLTMTQAGNLIDRLREAQKNAGVKS